MQSTSKALATLSTLFVMTLFLLCIQIAAAGISYDAGWIHRGGGELRQLAMKYNHHRALASRFSKRRIKLGYPVNLQDKGSMSAPTTHQMLNMSSSRPLKLSRSGSLPSGSSLANLHANSYVDHFEVAKSETSKPLQKSKPFRYSQDHRGLMEPLLRRNVRRSSWGGTEAMPMNRRLRPLQAADVQVCFVFVNVSRAL